MRVLHVITSLEIGGAEKLMIDLIPKLNKRGIKSDLLLFNGEETPFKKKISEQGVDIYHISYSKNVYNPMNILKLIPVLKKYDIIHTHNTAPQLFCVIANIFCQKKLITTEHSTNNRRRNKIIFKLLDKWMYSRYDRVICISQGVEMALRNYLSRFDYRIKTINNGIDLTAFCSSMNKSNLDNTGNIVLIMVGRFGIQKDQETIIRAMQYLPENVCLNLVGTGINESACKLLVEDLNLDKRVSFLGERTDIPELLKLSNIVIQSSHWEGFGLAAVEGMASGKPVIASDVEGLREVVNGYGLMFKNGDEHHLVEQIKALINSPNYYQEVALKCRLRAKEFSINKMVDEYISTYKEVM